MEKYYMYAYADVRSTKVIDIISLGDWHNEISSKTKVAPGVVTNIGQVFKNMKNPAPFNFTWVPNKGVPKSFFTTLKSGYDFTLEVRIQIREGDSPTSISYFNFYQCKYQKSQVVSGGVKVFASYGLFDMSDNQG